MKHKNTDGKNLVHYPKHFHSRRTSTQPEAKGSAVSHFQVLMVHQILYNLTHRGKVKNAERFKIHKSFLIHRAQRGKWQKGKQRDLNTLNVPIQLRNIKVVQRNNNRHTGGLHWHMAAMPFISQNRAFIHIKKNQPLKYTAANYTGKNFKSEDKWLKSGDRLKLLQAFKKQSCLTGWAGCCKLYSKVSNDWIQWKGWAL